MDTYATTQHESQNKTLSRNSGKNRHSATQRFANKQPKALTHDLPKVQQGTTAQRMLDENFTEAPLSPFPVVQQKADTTAKLGKNNTGLPDNLKSGIENLSGYAMDDVKVHYNSNKPAQLNAHAYAQGTDIHIASGQEKHLPHEAWHVVQQKQGRVKPTMQLQAGVNINDDKVLEKEADVMGVKAFYTQSENTDNKSQFNPSYSANVVQLERGEKSPSKHSERKKHELATRYDHRAPKVDAFLPQTKTDRVSSGRQKALIPVEGKSGEEYRHLIKFIGYGITPQQTKKSEEVAEATTEYINASNEEEMLKKKYGIKKSEDLVKAYDPLVRSQDKAQKYTNLQREFEVLKQKILTLTADAFIKKVKDDVAKAEEKKKEAKKRLSAREQELKNYKSKSYNEEEKEWLERHNFEKNRTRTDISKKYSQTVLSLSGLNEAMTKQKQAALNLEDAGVGSISIKGYVQISAGIGNGFAKVGAFGKVEKSSGMNIQDDRRFREVSGWKITGGGEMSLLFEIIARKLSGSYGRKTAHVFANAADYLKYDTRETYNKLMEITKGLPDVVFDDKTRSTLESLKKDYQNLKYTTVYSKEGSAEGEAKTVIDGTKGEYVSGTMKFVRSEDEGTKLKGTYEVNKVSQNIGPFSIEASETKIRKHKIVDNDGNYRNIKISVDAGVAEKYKKEKKEEDYGIFKKIVEASQTINNIKNFNSYYSNLTNEIKEIKMSDWLTVSLGGKKSLSVEWNMIEEESKYVNQYIRYSTSHGISGSIGASGSFGIGYAGAEVGGEKNTSLMISEKIGTNTLSYVQTVYDGYENRPELWRNWKFKHKNNIDELLVNLKKAKKISDSVTWDNLEDHLKLMQQPTSGVWVARNSTK